MGVKYDQTIMQSQVGRGLYDRWLWVHKKPCCPEWQQDFMKFYAWGIATGFTGEGTLQRYDRDEPYSPDNCYWAPQTEKAVDNESKRRAAEWNRVVNSIRKACGLCPLEEMKKENDDA